MQFFLQIIYKIQRKICVEVVPGPGPIIGLEENNNEISNFFTVPRGTVDTTVFRSLWAENYPIVGLDITIRSSIYQ